LRKCKLEAVSFSGIFCYKEVTETDRRASVALLFAMRRMDKKFFEKYFFPVSKFDLLRRYSG